MDENNNQVTSEAIETDKIETMADLDNLLAEDGEKKTSATTVTKTEEEPKEEEPDKEDPKTEENPTEEPKTPTDGGKVTENNMSKADNAFAAMRAQLNQQNKLLQKLANAKGMSVDALKESLNKEATEQAAAQLNVTPEVYERLSSLEEAKKNYEAELTRLKDERYRETQSKRLVAEIETVQKEQGLSDNQAREFVNETIAQGMDILKGNVPLNIVYKGIHFDDLVKAEVEKAKQEVIAQYSKADKYAASTVKSSGNADKDVNDITDMAALDALLGK